MPATAESIAYNEALVKKIQSGNIGELTDSSFDSKQYLKVSTTIRYTLYPDSKNKISDYMVGITSVAIDRDKDPEPGYLIGIGTPKVRVVQRGITELEENYVEQEITSTVNWGSNGIPTPSDWVPLLQHHTAQFIIALLTLLWTWFITIQQMVPIPYLTVSFVL